MEPGARRPSEMTDEEVIAAARVLARQVQTEERYNDSESMRGKQDTPFADEKVPDGPADPALS